MGDPHRRFEERGFTIRARLRSPAILKGLRPSPALYQSAYMLRMRFRQFHRSDLLGTEETMKTSGTSVKPLIISN